MNIEQLSYTTGEEDPRDVIMKRLGSDLCRIRTVLGARVLVATAPSPGRSKGGVIFSDKFKDEGRWQGKAGLVIKMGATAFKYDPRHPAYEWDEETHGPKAHLGDWVGFFTSDAREIGFGGISCRLIWDADITSILEDAEAIY